MGKASKKPAESTDSSETEELNACLEQLVSIYPEHDIDGLRSNLQNASKESRLEAVANILADLGNTRTRPYSQTVEPWQRFRTNSYKTAVSKTLRDEFNKLSEASVKAVLIENNWDYARSRESLSVISSRSWRVAIISFFSERLFGGSSKKTEVSSSTGCIELDVEMNYRKIQDQLEADTQLARQINEEYYQAEDSLFECQCCFGDYAWEDISFCSDTHYFCRRCLQSSIEQTLHGQGTGLDQARGSIRCISSTADPPCQAVVSPALLPHFIPPETMSVLEARLSQSVLDQIGDRALRCPFCPYAVIDNIPRFRTNILIQLGRILGFACCLYCIHDIPILFFSCLAAGALFWIRIIYVPPHVQHELDRFAQRRYRPQWATIFRCHNPRCKRSSCLECGREWIGMHKCSDEVFTNKRLYVERRVDEAIKRTCPMCQLSFVKSDGCNKMTCQCGYKMCYICRADIRTEGYNHFCNHFRMIPGTSCTDCSLCFLFQSENEDNVIRIAKAAAEQEWEAARGGEVQIDISRFAKPGSQLEGWDAILFNWYTGLT